MHSSLPSPTCLLRRSQRLLADSTVWADSTACVVSADRAVSADWADSVDFEEEAGEPCSDDVDDVRLAAAAAATAAALEDLERHLVSQVS